MRRKTLAFTQQVLSNQYSSFNARKPELQVEVDQLTGDFCGPEHSTPNSQQPSSHTGRNADEVEFEARANREAFAAFAEQREQSRPGGLFLHLLQLRVQLLYA